MPIINYAIGWVQCMITRTGVSRSCCGALRAGEKGLRGLGCSRFNHGGFGAGLVASAMAAGSGTHPFGPGLISSIVLAAVGVLLASFAITMLILVRCGDGCASRTGAASRF
jgi:hypothetical protein